MIYFLYTNYTPNSAETNRALSYLKSLDKAGKKLEVIFFLPDKYGSKISFQFTNIKVTYLWERFNIKHRILKYIPYIINILLFRLRLKRGDAVYIYGMNDVKRFFVGINGVKSFYECTEHPEVSLMPDKLRRCSLNEHIKTCKRLNGLFVISTALKDYYIKKGVASDRIHIINMTVDTSRFDGLLKNKNKEEYIAYCGKVSNNKDGVDQLIHAFSIVHKIIPDIKLYIVGAIPANLSNEHNIKLIQDLNLSEYVVLTGMLPADEIPQIMVDAEMLVLDRPDNLQARFGFPTKLGEYLLSANPVVVTGVGDIPLFLQDKDSALISPPNNPQAFAEKIVWALQNPDESKRIGYNGCKVARIHFNSDVEAKKLMTIIES